MTDLPRPATARELKAVLELERAGTPFLLYRDGDAAQRLFALDGGGTVAIGRGGGLDLRLDWDEQVSVVHAELTPVGSQWAIADDGLSRNGTFLNGQRLRGRQRLRSGDVLRLGTTTLVFHDGSAEAPSATIGVDDGPEIRLTPAQRRVLIALCRPYRERGGFVTPATNQAIAEELVISVEAVKTTLRVLYQRLGLDHLPQNEKRARLAERALQLGLVSVSEL